MNDFLMWFITKHWFVASILFPEIVLAWAVWMRDTGWACGMVAYLMIVRGLPLFVNIVKTFKSRD